MQLKKSHINSKMMQPSKKLSFKCENQTKKMPKMYNSLKLKKNCNNCRAHTKQKIKYCIPYLYMYKSAGLNESDTYTQNITKDE